MSIEVIHEDIQCPFCKENDFDLIGLKGHLLYGDCEVFEAVEKSVRYFTSIK